MDNAPSESRLSRLSLLFFCGIAAAALFVFFCHSANQAIFTQDAPAFWFQRMHDALKGRFFEVWFIEPWLGQRYGPISPDLNMIFLRWFDYPFSATLIFAVNLFIGGLGMYVLLRVLKLERFPCCFGGLAFLLTNTVITLIFPGHTYKLMTAAWIPFSIAAFVTALATSRLRYHILSGAFLGLALLGGEVQLAYYLGLWYGVWLVVHLAQVWRNGQLTVSQGSLQAGGLCLIAVCALVLAASTTFHRISYLSENQTITATVGTEKNWHFATQFYFPPEELLSYLTTIQFFGGPEAYWGRDGNPTPLRLSDDYMGLLPLGFAILGGIACWRIWQARLFIIMGIGSLLISFGREGGLYWFLYQLPTMKSQRNPHRWSYFVALATCVLAAYGIQWFLQQLNENGNRLRDWSRWQRNLLIAGLFGALLFIAAGAFLLMPESVAAYWYPSQFLSSSQGSLGLRRAEMMLGSLTRTGLFLSLSTLSVLWLIRTHLGSGAGTVRGGWGRKIRLSFFILLMVVLADLGVNARRYIQFYSWRESLDCKELVGFLRQDKDLFRVKVLAAQQNPILNPLITFILPFHGIPVLDPPAISRMPVEYEKFFNFCQQHYVRSDRYFDYFNIKYVFSSGPFQDPMVKFASVAQWQGIYIYKRDTCFPRAWLAGNARVVTGDDEAVLSATLHPSLNLRQTVVLSEKPRAVPVDGAAQPLSKDPSPKHVAHKEPSTASDLSGDVNILRYTDNELEVEASADGPTILVIGEKWDPGWKAWVNGEPSRILRANYLMRAVEVPPGKNRVRMEYRPSLTGFWISTISVLGLALVGAVYGIRRVIRLLENSGTPRERPLSRMARRERGASLEDGM
jgi:hypothetical protein